MYSIIQYADTLFEVLQDTQPKDHDKVIDNFANILKDNGDFALYSEIIKELTRLIQDKKEAKKVEITSAKPLDIKEENKIIQELNSHIGQDIELKKAVDEGLISGLVIKIDDEIIDGSMKKRIENLKSDLTN